VIGSVASLHTTLHEVRCLPGSVDRAQVGRRQLALWTEAMCRFLAVRDEIGEDRFVDVRNEDVVKRPIETFERIYDRLGMSLTPALRSRLEDYNNRNAPGAFGAHQYTAEEYGLTDASIREAFKDYGERFGLWEKVA
jgi:Sulfotransferase family